MTSLAALGFGPFFSQQLDLPAEAGLAPARVLVDLGVRLLLDLGGEERMAHLPAALHGVAAVGDWVLCEPLEDGTAVLRRVLARRSVLSRQAAGTPTGEQVLAANVDLVLLVEPLDPGPNLRRLERMLVAVRASGAEPAVLLTKADLRPDAEDAARQVGAVAGGAAVLVISARSGLGLEAVHRLVGPGTTAALMGQSGVGKSTLLNALRGGEAEPTGALDAEGRGRHITTWRRLWALPSGGFLVDGPGIRELQLWAGEGVAVAFADVATLAARCRFSDCAHGEEPGCAVRQAVADGTLEAGRLASYRKLALEAAALAARHGAAARQAERRAGRIRERALRDLQRRRGR
jgi:ribosome biogenesis GTPase / thiamine phosphate phosphatase